MIKLLKIFDDNYLDVWKYNFVDLTTDVRVSPTQLKSIEWLNLSYKVLIEDVQELIEQVSTPLKAPLDFFDEYHSFEEYTQFIDDLASNNPSIATIQQIGSTNGGNTMVLIRITANTSPSRPKIYIEGGIHAREWISPITTIYMANSLIEGYNNGDQRIISLLQTFEFIILPNTNPDGYEYSRTSSRLWRKNRTPNQGSTCIGTDLNRNWGYMWNTGGSSSNPCSDTYHGTAAFDQLETANVRDFLSTLGNVVGFLDVHSYGQYWLYPWGYTTSQVPQNNAQLISSSLKAIDALRDVHGTVYTYGNSAIHLYVASGGADDYALGGAGIPFSYTVELRDTGRYGFVLPPAQIKPTGEETFAALLALVEYIEGE